MKTALLPRRRLALILLAATLPIAPALAQEAQPPADPPASEPQPKAEAPAQPIVEPPAPEPTTEVAPAEPAATSAPPPRRTAPPRSSAPARQAAPSAPVVIVPAPPPSQSAPYAVEVLPPATGSVAELPPEVLPAPAVEPVPVEVAERPEEPREPTTVVLWLLGGLLLGGLLTWFLLRRRRRESIVVDERRHFAAAVAEPEVVPAAPVAAPAIAPVRAAEPVRAEPLTAAPAIAAVPLGGVVASHRPPAQPRPWLDLLIHPVRAGMTGDGARVEFALDVANSGDAPAQDVRVSTRMFQAGATEAERGLIDRVAAADGDTLPPTTIEAGAGQRIEAAMALSSAEIAGDAMVPVIVAEAVYRLPDGSQGRTSASFAIGVPDGEALAAFGTEHPSGLHEDVEARALGEPEKA